MNVDGGGGETSSCPIDYGDDDYAAVAYLYIPLWPHQKCCACIRARVSVTSGWSCDRENTGFQEIYF